MAQHNLLERQPYLDALDESLRAVAESGGRIALVSGEAGIGKTSLLERFVAAHTAEQPPKHRNDYGDAGFSGTHTFNEPGQPELREIPNLSDEDWQTVHKMLETWQEVWRGDKAKYADKYPAWMVNAAAELFAEPLSPHERPGPCVRAFLHVSYVQSLRWKPLRAA
jgi:hypothetical protein